MTIINLAFINPNFLLNHNIFFEIFKKKYLMDYIIKIYALNGDWGLGIGDWGLGPIPNPQSPIPNPQSPIPISL